MARRKSRSNQSAPAASAGPSTVPCAGVRKSTCLLVAVAALLLGFYLGTLAPRFLNSATPSASLPASPARSEQAQTPARPVAPPPMPPELAAEMARLEKSLLENPADARQWAMLGNLYFDTDQPRQAIKAYENSLRLEPGNADVLTDLGIMYRETGDFAAAVESFRKAVQAEPRHENALFNEGVVLYYDLQRREEALAAWQRLLQLNPQARTPDGKAVAEMLTSLP